MLLLTGFELLSKWFCEFHEEKTGGLLDFLTFGAAPGWFLYGKGVSIAHDDEDFFRSHFSVNSKCIIPINFQLYVKIIFLLLKLLI